MPPEFEPGEARKQHYPGRIRDEGVCPRVRCSPKRCLEPRGAPPHCFASECAAKRLQSRLRRRCRCRAQGDCWPRCDPSRRPFHPCFGRKLAPRSGRPGCVGSGCHCLRCRTARQTNRSNTQDREHGRDRVSNRHRWRSFLPGPRDLRAKSCRRSTRPSSGTRSRLRAPSAHPRARWARRSLRYRRFARFLPCRRPE